MNIPVEPSAPRRGGTHDLIVATPRGLHCEAGGFYIDPWQPAERAIVTHGHSDHLRAGSAHYFLNERGIGVARVRIGEDAPLQPLRYGEPVDFNGVEVSLHPAGHVLGSSQVRVAHGGEVWVFSGDYKRDPDPTCEPFEPIRCDVFISEATFALPVYRWVPTPQVVADIHEWWRANQARGVTSVLCVYALGKAQRVLAELQAYTDTPAIAHGAVQSIVQVYRDAGVSMLPTRTVAEVEASELRGSLVIAPPSVTGSPWLRRFGEISTGFCSGWMRVRGDRRRRGYDRGFVISDHADWPSLLQTFEETGARRILLTHGHTETMTRYLRERGIDAAALRTEYGAEE